MSIPINGIDNMDHVSAGKCHYMTKLIKILTEDLPPWPLSSEERLFERLLTLENEACAAGAPERTRRAIASARLTAGLQSLKTDYSMRPGH